MGKKWNTMSSENETGNKLESIERNSLHVRDNEETVVIVTNYFVIHIEKMTVSPS